MDGDYQFDDIDTTSAPSPQGTKRAAHASDLFSKTIQAKFRTFYIDLKESSNGKFVKVSEKSHGRKSTIMLDAEDLAAFIEALQEVQANI